MSNMTLLLLSYHLLVTPHKQWGTPFALSNFRFALSGLTTFFSSTFFKCKVAGHCVVSALPC